jgi:fructose/tagatose bisphosphate aldolase
VSAAKPAQMTLPALRAHCKALEDCLARANKELRAAKKDLKHREEQVTFHADHARKNAEDAQSMREVLRSVLSTLSAEHVEDAAQIIAEWVMR